MGFFNFIETFFFLSLGITFVLILLLVYHFKQRLSALENKCDTVFEIISNVVKELNNIKQAQHHNPFTNIPIQNMMELNTIIPSFHMNEVNGKIKVSDEDFEEDDDEDEEADDSDDGSVEDGEGEGSVDSDSVDSDVDNFDDLPPLISVDSDDDAQNSSIKIINVEIGDTIEADIIETEPELDQENNDETDKIEPIELQEDEEKIHVEKLEETSTLENTNSEVSSATTETSKDIYSKMSVSELKALVITKGLSSDPSKKKKNELLKMLEAAEN